MRAPLALLLCLGACTSSRFSCGSEDGLCEVADGEYLAVVPDGWDGEALLPAILHFHGYGGTAEELFDKRSFTDPMGEVGAVAVYPDGIDESWNFRVGGRVGDGRDEVGFTRQVVTDAVARFPIDPERIVISGFSIGGTMAWEVACRDGELAAAFAPVSGTFWEPLPEACQASTARLRHEHGTNDTTFPLDGRTLGSRDWRQGAAAEAIDVLRTTRGCMGEPRVEEQGAGLTCQVWDDCELGTNLQFCLHDGGHRVVEGWHRRTLDWAFGEQD